jgi:hypothetical protein
MVSLYVTNCQFFLISANGVKFGALISSQRSLFAKFNDFKIPISHFFWWRIIGQLLLQAKFKIIDGLQDF